jgi:hypothetical protein
MVERLYNMRTETPSNRTWSRLWIGLGIGTLGLAILGWMMSGPPQLQADEDVLKSLDGLFTALTSKSTPRLVKCEERLTELHAQGKIANSSWKQIVGFMESAKREDWESASRGLYRFIELQKGAR